MADVKNLDCLLANTRVLLLDLIETAPFLKYFVLVGGSALALHLCHRKSEDLDFFTYQDGFDKAGILDYMRRFDRMEVINQSSDQLDLLINGVKVTFFNARWSFLRPDHVRPFNLASLESIAAMKVNTLFLRAKFRDYYDLYCLAKDVFSLRQIFEVSQVVVNGVNFKLFSVALVYIDDIDDDHILHLEPVYPVSKQEIGRFFEKQLGQLLVEE